MPAQSMPAARQRWEGSMDDIGWLLPVAGGLTGMVIGAAARLNRFCTLAALERHWYAGDSTGLRTWVLAAALAIVSTQALVLSRAIELSAAFSPPPRFRWHGAIHGVPAFALRRSPCLHYGVTPSVPY